MWISTLILLTLLSYSAMHKAPNSICVWSTELLGLPQAPVFEQLYKVSLAFAGASFSSSPPFAAAKSGPVHKSVACIRFQASRGHARSPRIPTVPSNSL